MKKLILLLVLAGCQNRPPPLEKGKCVVVEYSTGDDNGCTKSSNISECVYEGYVWTCTNSRCSRKHQAGAEDRP